MTMTYEKTVSITDESGTLRNIINYRTYSRLAEKADGGKAAITEEEVENGGSREGTPKNPSSGPQDTPLKSGKKEADSRCANQTQGRTAHKW